MILKSKHQRGFGLVIALFAVAIVTGLLTSLYQFQSGQYLVREAKIVGLEAVKISRAARIYSRDQIALIPDLVTQLSIQADGFGGSGPQLIDPDDIINAGLLPQGFARNNGTNFTNTLGQTINIYLANYPIDGDPTLASTVPTAYVVFLDNTKTTSRLNQDIVATMRSQDVAISTPVFNGATNVTGVCNGRGDTVALWDSGCLDTLDYDLLVDGVAGDSSGDDIFIPGSLIIPTWRTVSFDTRAVVRFQQPEQTDVQTMLTNLEMAEMNDCSLGVNFINIPGENSLTSETTLCSALSDINTTGSEVDNRRSIFGVNNIINSSGLIINPQTNDINISASGIVTSAISEPDAFDITGSFIGVGDAVINGNTTNITGDLVVDKNITVSGDTGGATLPASAAIGTINARRSSSTDLNVVSRAILSNDVTVGNVTENIGELTITSNFSPQILRGSISGGTPEIQVSEEAQITGSLTPNSLTVTGTGDPIPTTNNSFIATSLIVQSLSASDLSVGRQITALGTTETKNIDVTNGGNAQCLGDCPLRARNAQCDNLEAARSFPNNFYNSFQDCLNDR